MEGVASTTAALNAALAKRPIFGRRQVQHSPPHPVTQLVAANGKVVLILQNKTVQRYGIREHSMVCVWKIVVCMYTVQPVWGVHTVYRLHEYCTQYHGSAVSDNTQLR